MGDCADGIHIARLQEQVKALQEAIKLQAAEYERRLAELNHAHKVAAQRNSEFVSIAIWSEQREALIQKLAALENWRARTTGTMIGVAIGSSIAGGSLGALLSRLL